MSAYYYVNVAQIQGVPETVTLLVAGLPPGVSWVAAPRQAVPTFRSVVRLDVGSSGPPTPGRYAVMIEARGQTQTRRTQVSLDLQ